MTKIPYVKAGEPLVGAENVLGRADTVNRPLRQYLITQGIDPDGDIPLLAGETIAQAASVAARTALYPSPTTNTKVVRTDTQAVETYNGSAWVSGESKRTENPVSSGADPTGAADSRAAFVTAVAAGRDIALTKGTYRIASDLTISSALWFEQGALLKPDANVTVTLSGALHAGNYQLFDLSAGGVVSFTPNQTVHEYVTSWWGVGTFSDDGPAMNAMLRALPDSGAVVRHPPKADIRLATTVLFANLQNVTLITNADPRSDGGPTIHWVGRTGGRMVYLQTCRVVTIDGFFWRGPNACGTVIDMNGVSGSGRTFGATLSIAAGSRTLTDSAGSFVADDIGRTVIVPGAGPNGSPLYAVISDVPSSTTATLDPDFPAAATTVTSKAGGRIPPQNIGSACRVFRNNFLNEGQSPSYVAVSIAFTAPSNWEYCDIRDNSVNGYSPRVKFTRDIGVTASIGAGSHTLTTSAAFFTSDDVGKRVRVANAGGPATDYSGGGVNSVKQALDTTITAYTSPTQVTVAGTAVDAVAGVLAYVGAKTGTGVRNGFSYNAKGHVIARNTFNDLEVGIYNGGGSYFSQSNSFSICEICHYVDINSDSASDVDGNTEQCGTYLFASLGAPFAIRNLRHNVAPVQIPNRSAIHLHGGNANNRLWLGSVSWQSMTQMLPSAQTGCFIYHQGINASLIYGASVSYDDLANLRSTQDAPLAIVGDTALAYPYGSLVQDHPVFETVGGRPALTGRVATRNNDAGTYIGVKGETIYTGYGPGGFAVVGENAADGLYSNSEYVAVQARQAKAISNGTAGTSTYGIGFDCTTPDHTALTVPAGAAGIRIQKQNGVKVSPALGIDQQDTGDLNNLAGVVQHGSGRILKVGTSVAVTSYTPDAGIAEVQRITAAASFTLNAPLWRTSSTIPDGAHMRISVRNSSGSAITVTLNSIYRVGTMPSVPANSIVSFVASYDLALAKWVLVGAMGVAI